MISNDREYRSFEMRALDGETMIVEGYAATFDTPTVIYEYDGVQYKETINRDAFSGCAMSDVVFNFNHMGKPVARTKNGTLTLTVDNKGLLTTSDLSGTTESRQLYEEIKGGYIDKMSFAFTVRTEKYDKETRTREIMQLDRLFDVAAVVHPAYDSTNLSARNFFEAQAEAEQRELAEATARLAEARSFLVTEAMAKAILTMGGLNE